MRQEIIGSLICSACVGLATVVIAVFVNQTNINNLNRRIDGIESNIKDLKIENRLTALETKLTPQEQQQLKSFVESGNFQQNATLEELLSSDSLSPDLKSIIEEHQLTGSDLDDFRNYR